MKQCAVDGCLAPVHGRGLCGKHCRRLRETGSVDGNTKPSVEERFWAKVDKSGGADACWPWRGCVDRYGVFNSPVGCWAHRYSYTINVGVIGEKMLVCHTCDNPVCVNPRHLFAGTSADNCLDSVRKNRQAKGEGNGQSKLRERDVSEIHRRLASGENQRRLSREFGVSQSAISAIATGLTWRMVIAAKRNAAQAGQNGSGQ